MRTNAFEVILRVMTFMLILTSSSCQEPRKFVFCTPRLPFTVVSLEVNITNIYILRVPHNTVTGRTSTFPFDLTFIFCVHLLHEAVSVRLLPAPRHPGFPWFLLLVFSAVKRRQFFSASSLCHLGMRRYSSSRIPLPVPTGHSLPEQ